MGVLEKIHSVREVWTFLELKIVRQPYDSCVQVEIFWLDDWSKSTGDDEVESVIKVVLRLTA